MPGSNGAVSSNRSNTAMTAVTLANGSQFQVPTSGPCVGDAGAPVVVRARLPAQAVRRDIRIERAAVRGVGHAAAGRQASPETIPVLQSGVSGLTVVGVVTALDDRELNQLGRARLDALVGRARGCRAHHEADQNAERFPRG